MALKRGVSFMLDGVGPAGDEEKPTADQVEGVEDAEIDIQEEEEEGRTGGKKRKGLMTGGDESESASESESDSEEGGEVAKYELDEDAMEGEEDKTESFNDKGELITPFNLREEEAEGHFDKDGMYYFKKNTEAKDPWLESVNWNEDVAHNAKAAPVKSILDVDEEMEAISQMDELQKIVGVLQPGETVTKALKRLGGGASAAAGRKWQQKKKTQPIKPEVIHSEDDKANLLKLTEAADRLLQSGYYNVYSDTRELLAKQLDTSSVIGQAKSSILIGSKPPVTKKAKSESDAIDDIYGDDEAANEIPGPSNAPITEEKIEDVAITSEEASVQWEYKWSEESSEIFGPFSSETMNEWKEAGMFSSDVMVRKVGEAVFYKCARIDFDLYT